MLQGGAAAAGPAGDGALAGLAGQSHLLNWADKTFGQGLSSLTKGDHLHPLDLLRRVRLYVMYCMHCQLPILLRLETCMHQCTSNKLCLLVARPLLKPCLKAVMQA